MQTECLVLVPNKHPPCPATDSPTYFEFEDWVQEKGQDVLWELCGHFIWASPHRWEIVAMVMVSHTKSHGSPEGVECLEAINWLLLFSGHPTKKPYDPYAIVPAHWPCKICSNEHRYHLLLPLGFLVLAFGQTSSSLFSRICSFSTWWF